MLGQGAPAAPRELNPQPRCDIGHRESLSAGKRRVTTVSNSSVVRSGRTERGHGGRISTASDAPLIEVAAGRPHGSGHVTTPPAWGDGVAPIRVPGRDVDRSPAAVRDQQRWHRRGAAGERLREVGGHGPAGHRRDLDAVPVQGRDQHPRTAVPVLRELRRDVSVTPVRVRPTESGRLLARPACRPNVSARPPPSPGLTRRGSSARGRTAGTPSHRPAAVAGSRSSPDSIASRDSRAARR